MSRAKTGTRNPPCVPEVSRASQPRRKGRIMRVRGCPVSWMRTLIGRDCRHVGETAGPNFPAPGSGLISSNMPQKRSADLAMSDSHGDPQEIASAAHSAEIHEPLKYSAPCPLVDASRREWKPRPAGGNRPYARRAR